MTTELEEQFFRVFGIEPLRHVCYRGFDNCIDNDYNCHCHNKKPCKDSHTIYPEITGDILLQLIVIRATNYKNGTVIELEPDSNIEDLKYEVLTHFINYRGSFDKHQIQQLFKEGE